MVALGGCLSVIVKAAVPKQAMKPPFRESLHGVLFNQHSGTHFGGRFGAVKETPR